MRMRNISLIGKLRIFKFCYTNTRLKIQPSDLTENRWPHKNLSLQKNNKKIHHEKKRDKKKSSKGDTFARTFITSILFKISTSKFKPKVKSFLINTFFSRYFFQALWILNHGSNVYICNNIIKHCFVKNRDENDEKIVANTQILKMKTYESIEIFFENKYAKRLILLKNVKYIFIFMTNIVFEFIFF